ncbi:MAG: TIGR01777 family oxidoreductase [Halobacteriota archaeon]
MKVFITGGTGFIGSKLSQKLIEDGHEVTVLTRDSHKAKKELPNIVNVVEGDPTREGNWQQEIAGHDAVVNLAGASIFSRWSKKYKKIIRDSRILTTRNIVSALESSEDKTLLNASAVGYYGFHGDEVVEETSPAGSGFLADVTREWENTALQAQQFNSRVVLCRFGIVLGEEGGAMDKLIPLFKYYLGSPLGDGKQWFSWIHIDDLVNALVFLLNNKGNEGPVNCTSPHPVRNEEFTQTLAEVMGKRVIMPSVPEFILKIVLGEFADTVVKGQRVIPQKLMDNGFEFKYPEIREALEDIVLRS